MTLRTHLPPPPPPLQRRGRRDAQPLLPSRLLSLSCRALLQPRLEMFVLSSPLLLPLPPLLPLFRVSVSSAARPHPDKTEGEDTHLLHSSSASTTAAIYDGVGSWSFEQEVDVAAFSQRMRAATADVLAASPDMEPQQLMQAVWEAMDRDRIPGSSTACLLRIACHGEQPELTAASVGDTGFLVLRRRVEGEKEEQAASAAVDGQQRLLSHHLLQLRTAACRPLTPPPLLLLLRPLPTTCTTAHCSSCTGSTVRISWGFAYLPSCIFFLRVLVDIIIVLFVSASQSDRCLRPALLCCDDSAVTAAFRSGCPRFRRPCLTIWTRRRSRASHRPQPSPLSPLRCWRRRGAAAWTAAWTAHSLLRPRTTTYSGQEGGRTTSPSSHSGSSTQQQTQRRAGSISRGCTQARDEQQVWLRRQPAGSSDTASLL